VDEYYPDALVFKPWRFYDMQPEEKEDVKYLLATPTKEYLSFGYGKHACPGRFFAAVQMKAAVAHIVTHYDVKLETPGQIPPSRWHATTLVPNRIAKVLFRIRQSA